jgi:glyceraldehyde 3-phosphate dehydrogenase
MTVNIGINGFGRIGRNILRQIYLRNKVADLKVVAVNDLTDSKTLAHLLKYDSAHGRFPGKIDCSPGGLSVEGNEIKILSERDPSKLPWKELGVDIVLECTGIFRSKEKASAHLEGGAKKVIISAPSPDPDATFVMGVNNDSYQPENHHIVSCASCTTNCLAPVAKVLMENFGIVKGTMTTIHAYTNDQRILDLPHKDLRRARAACLSMIPTTTGAAKAVGLVLPELAGKVDGFAIRVPTPDASIVDFVAEVEKDTSADEVNSALKAASEGPLNGILGYSEEPLVSVDYIGNPNSSTVDSACTMVIGDRMVKVVSWYDNEMGFSSRMVDLSLQMGESL